MTSLTHSRRSKRCRESAVHRFGTHVSTWNEWNEVVVAEKSGGSTQLDHGKMPAAVDLDLRFRWRFAARVEDSLQWLNPY